MSNSPTTRSPFDLSGKVALITGGSRGIGAGIARTLAAGGARCMINYVADPRAENETLARALAEELPASAIAQADVGDQGQVAAMFDDLRKNMGGLDILINNAGILRDRSLKKITLEDFETVIRVNLTGAFNCLRHAAKTLRPGGRVVNIISVSAFLGIFGQSNYAPSKAGLMALTRVAAQELAKQKITVNAVAPGVVDTEIIKDMPPDARAKILEQVPLGRIGQVQDIANAVAFLCSPLADYITGQVIHVNGGLYMG